MSVSTMLFVLALRIKKPTKLSLNESFCELAERSGKEKLSVLTLFSGSDYPVRKICCIQFQHLFIQANETGRMFKVSRKGDSGRLWAKNFKFRVTFDEN